MEITIRIVPPRLSRSRRRVLALGAAFALLALPALAAAGHQFNDVPNSNPYHGAIDDIADAGITAGCGSGNFCPAEPVLRGQEAAFLGRGLGRVAWSQVIDENTITVGDGWVTIADLEVRVPGIGGYQFVLVDGEVTAFTDGDGIGNCGGDCSINTRVREAGGDISNVGYYTYPEDSYHQQVIGRHFVFDPSSGDHTYQLQARLIDGDGTLFFQSLSLTATTHAMAAITDGLELESIETGAGLPPLNNGD
jgi:hypothetical protein